MPLYADPVQQEEGCKSLCGLLLFYSLKLTRLAYQLCGYTQVVMRIESNFRVVLKGMYNTQSGEVPVVILDRKAVRNKPVRVAWVHLN